MAKIWSGDIRFYGLGYDLGTATTSVGWTLQVAPLDVTTIGQLAERQVAGIRQDSMEWGGIFDDSLSADAAGSALLGSGTNNVLQVHVGTATGGIAYASTGLMLHHKMAASKSDLVMSEAEFKVDGRWRRGQTLLTKTTFTGSGSSGAMDGTALSTGTSALFVQVFAFSGAGSGTIHLESASTATGVYTSFATLTAATATKSYVVTATGSLDRFARVIKTATGTLDMAAVVVRNY